MARVSGKRAGRAVLGRACVIALLVAGMHCALGESADAAWDPEYDWFWVFYEKGGQQQYHTTVYRPFYLTNRYPGERTFTASLMPLVYWEYTTPRRTEWRSLAFFAHAVDYRHADGTPDYDMGVFPFVFYGNSPDEKDRYLMVWPIGGTIKGKLGQKRISPWVFPGFLLYFVVQPGFSLAFVAIFAVSFLPVYVEYEAKDYSAWGLVWPLVQRGKGPRRDDFRILPFYAHNVKKDRYDSYSFLLLANYQRVYLERDVERTVFILPIFGRRWLDSGEAGAASLFWPLFSWGYNRKNGDFELNFPGPLVMIQDSAEPFIHKRVFFPFYGRYVRGLRETFFITPLYFTQKHVTPAYAFEFQYHTVIIWYFKRDYYHRPDAHYGSSWRYFKIWPLFQYEKDDRGNVSFNSLSILPFRDDDGYELLYQPFWTLFEYRRSMSGEKRMGFLLRTYFQRWGDDFFQMKIPLLLSYSEAGGEIGQLSVLLSMFGYTRDDRGSRIRLFWIPITIDGRPGKGVPEEAPGPPAAGGPPADSRRGAGTMACRAPVPGETYSPENCLHYMGRIF